MEPRIDSCIRDYFSITAPDIKTYSPLALAYIGDSIYDLVIRTIVVGNGNTGAGRMHRATSQLVCAHAQASMAKILLPYLRQDEADYYRRGRNAKSPTMAKNATMSDYRSATGFETLLGYLYITDQFARILRLIEIGIEGYRAELSADHPCNRQNRT